MMIRGTAYWAKVVGKPVKAYNPGEFEWTIDVAIDEATRKALAKAGLGDRVKNKGDDRGDFIQFKRKSVKADGEPAKPIAIVDSKGQPWDDKTLIGNGSIVNVKFIINEITMQNGRKILKPNILKMQVWEHVPYESKGDDFPVKEDNETKGKAEEWDTEDDE